jgi:hypothetical protein
MLVSAADADGRPLAGLGPDDFVLREGGVLREILDARPAHYPAAILIDTSAFARPVFFQLRRALTRFLDAMSDREVALYSFGDTAMRVANFSRDMSRLRRAADGLFADPQGQTHTADAIVRAAEDLRKRGTPLSTIVVLSAGGIDRSGRSPMDVTSAVLASRSIVHVIDMRATVGSGAPADRPRSRGAAVDNSYITLGADQLLRDLPARTLGRYMQVFGPSGFDESLDALRRQLAAEVVVEYLRPTETPAGPLQIGTRVPGATARGVGLERDPR